MTTTVNVGLHCTVAFSQFTTWWSFFNRREFVIALILAEVFAANFEFVPVGAWIRGLVRRIGNRLSERSTKRLAKRLADLERYSESVAAYVSSDKVHYPQALGLVLSNSVAVY